MIWNSFKAQQNVFHFNRWFINNVIFRFCEFIKFFAIFYWSTGIFFSHKHFPLNLLKRSPASTETTFQTVLAFATLFFISLSQYQYKFIAAKLESSRALIKLQFLFNKFLFRALIASLLILFPSLLLDWMQPWRLIYDSIYAKFLRCTVNL